MCILHIPIVNQRKDGVSETEMRNKKTKQHIYRVSGVRRKGEGGKGVGVESLCSIIGSCRQTAKPQEMKRGGGGVWGNVRLERSLTEMTVSCVPVASIVCVIEWDGVG